MNFDVAFTKLLGHEGGYSNHPSDPGGETMWGVTKRVAEEHGYHGPMKLLPEDFAKQVYRKSYWDAVSADELPLAIRYAMFDAAVNSGPGQAIRWLQEAAGTAVDGELGPKTKKALETLNSQELKMKIVGARLKFMASLSTWPAFGRGWARRLASILSE